MQLACIAVFEHLVPLPFACYSGVMRCSAQPSTGTIAVQRYSAKKKVSPEQQKPKRTDQEKDGELGTR